MPIVPHSDIVDTNGCGDAFVGGFLSRLVACGGGHDVVEECVVEGHRCAQLILRQRGCSLSSWAPVVGD